MKKKPRESFKKDFNFKGGELFHRMDYLLKLSSHLYNKKPNLSQLYVNQMKEICKRNALRMDSKFKKLICDKCNNLLYMDSQTEISLKSRKLFIILLEIKGKQKTIFKCHQCGNISEIIIL